MSGGRNVVVVAAIDFIDGLVLLDNGESWPIAHMFDCRGEETDDVEECCHIIAGTDNRCITLDVRSFKKATIH